ncbi:unnamed protein product [Dicrocoelium dendriticum]|nr:unnamed protein product [Dicrocoelium dendriticum]
MSSITWFSYFVGVWASIYLTDAALRSHPYTRQWYHEFTARLGISFDVFQARVFTQRLNRLFQSICRFDYVPWRIWFSCGVFFSLIFMALSIGLLTLLIYNTVTQKTIKGVSLTPVVPGVNLPMNHVGFYLLTLLLCAFLHEAGHALAALRERVRLHGVGVFLFGFYPGAYVDLNTADLQSLQPFSQLRVYCAGVWHNAVIALLSVAVFYATPFLLSPGYHTGAGVGVAFLRENSVVTGNHGLYLGDSITRVNSCPVKNQSDWYRCLEETHTRPSGYCVSGVYLNSVDASLSGSPKGAGAQRRTLAAVRPSGLDSGGSDFDAAFHSNSVLTNTMQKDCCSHHSTSTHLCFSYPAPTKHGQRSIKYACLPARPVTERSTCHTASDCGLPGLVRAAAVGAPGSAGNNPVDSALVATSRSMWCVFPSPPDNRTRLVRLEHSRKEAPAILFLGPLDDLIASVGVSDYIPRWPNLLSARLPALWTMFCTYLFSISGALVILNVVPCYALDGQWILHALIDLCLSGLLPCRRKRLAVFHVVLYAGTLLLSVNVALALWCFGLNANLVSVQSSQTPSSPLPQGGTPIVH